MMKWRKRSSSCGLGRHDKDSVDGCTKEEALSRSYNDAEILASLSRDSPFEDLMLEEIYNQFTIQHKKDIDECNDVFIVSTPKNRYHIRHKSDKRTSPASLPSIEEGVESDELASIADSGICDDDLDFDIDNRSKYGSLTKNKSYFEPLKNPDDEEFLRLRSETDDLLSCINDELNKRNTTNEFPNERKRTKSNEISEDILSRMRHFENIKTDSRSQEKLSKGESDKISSHKKQRPFSTDFSETFKDETHFFGRLSKKESRSLEDLSSVNSYNQNKIRTKPEKPTTLPLLSSTPNLKKKQHKNNETRQNIADVLQNTNTNLVHDDTIDLPSSLMSSMLWNGQTSDRPPSVTDIYQTMPPNRYPKRNKDFMTQLRDIQEDSKTQQTAKEFRVNLDVNHYSPEEILVTLEDGKLIVNGKHFSESEYGFESCQFHRRYPIPDGIRKSDIKSTISEDGILTIIGRVGPPEVQAKPTAKGRFSHYDNVDGSSISPFEKVAQQSTTSPPTSPRSPQSPTALNVHKAANEPRPMPRPQKHKVIQEDDFNEVDHDTYLLKVNCVSYSPEDMEVRVNGRELIVRGRQKYTQLEDGQERLRHKEFTKRFSIPRQADCNTITSRFTDQDLLFVEVKKLKFNTRR